jgi:hypothetical protein
MKMPIENPSISRPPPPWQSIAVVGVVFASLGTQALGAEHWIYLDNKQIRLGVNMDAGGSIGWFSHSRSSRNLLNSYDHGRYVQQSYYGDKDGSDWNGKPWRFNPVQGGSWKGVPATVIEHNVEDDRLYVKSRPRHWASGADISDMFLEQWVRLDGGFARLKYRMTYTGKASHTNKTHQELPAVFVDAKLHTLVFCNESQPPWINAPLTRLQPGPPGSQGNIVDTCERWAAWVDEHDQGLGIYFPHTTNLTSYRVSDTGEGDCSYLAPLQTWAIQAGMTFEYETVLAIGTVEQIRAAFRKISGNLDAR